MKTTRLLRLKNDARVGDPPKAARKFLPDGAEAGRKMAGRGSCVEASGPQLAVKSGDCRGKTGTSGASVTGETCPGLAPGARTPIAPPPPPKKARAGGEERPLKERDPVKTHSPQFSAGKRSDGPLGMTTPRPGMALSFVSGATPAAPCAASGMVLPTGRLKESLPPPPELSAGDPSLYLGPEGKTDDPASQADRCFDGEHDGHSGEPGRRSAGAPSGAALPVSAGELASFRAEDPSPAKVPGVGTPIASPAGARAGRRGVPPLFFTMLLALGAGHEP